MFTLLQEKETKSNWKGRWEISEFPPCPHHHEHTAACDGKGPAWLTYSYNSPCGFQIQQNLFQEEEAPCFRKVLLSRLPRGTIGTYLPIVSPAQPLTRYGLLSISECFV